MIHKDLQNRWPDYSFNFQMANVSADVFRTMYWNEIHKKDRGQKAFERALELLTFTILDKKHSKYRRKELCRVREVLIDYFYGENIYKSSDQLWKNYFRSFEYLASLERKNILDQRKKV